MKNVSVIISYVLILLLVLTFKSSSLLLLVIQLKTSTGMHWQCAVAAS